MVAKKYRLPLQTTAQRRGTLLRGRYFIIKVLPAEKAFSRIGVVVGKKVSVLATTRNRIKRIAYRYWTPTGAPHDYVLMAEASAGNAADDAIISELQSLAAQ